MRLLAGLLCCLGLSAVPAVAQVPLRSPDVEGTVAEIIKPVPADKTEGVLLTVVIKGSEVRFRITRDTVLQIQKGKLVEEGTVESFKIGDRVSAWWKGGVEKSDPPRALAEALIIFRPGKASLPPRP